MDPPFYLAQKLDLANVSISRVFSLPPILPSQDRKDSASLYLQVGPSGGPLSPQQLPSLPPRAQAPSPLLP